MRGGGWDLRRLTVIPGITGSYDEIARRYGVCDALKILGLEVTTPSDDSTGGSYGKIARRKGVCDAFKTLGFEVTVNYEMSQKRGAPTRRTCK